jgi:hypothetical protein
MELGQPLPESVLGEPVRRATSAAAPLPARMMAAKGLAPLPPRDLAAALYQLQFDADAAIGEAARKTAAALPDAILKPLLVEPLASPVLDFFGRSLRARGELVALVAINVATPDATIELLAKEGDEPLTELIATNEQRLLRCPDIIAALYFNPRTRMSTSDRLIELAVRNHVRVAAIPSFDDVAAALLGEPKADAAQTAALDEAFAAAAALLVGGPNEAEAARAAALAAGGDGDEPTIDQLAAAAAEGKSADAVKKIVRIQDLPSASKIRLATVGNAFARAILIRDSKKTVALATAKSPALTEEEMVKFAASRNVCDDVIRYIANAREYLRLYPVKVQLVFNPKCPTGTAVKLLSYLQDKDLKKVAASKSVPAAVATSARRLIATRSEK